MKPIEIDMTGWPRLTLEDEAAVKSCIETLAREAEKQGRDPQAVIDAAGPFGRGFAAHHGTAFQTRVSRHEAAGGAVVHLIEPPVGCSLCLIAAKDALVMIDSGFQCYRDELLALVRRVAPDFDGSRKVMLLTHADIDHCGLADLADEVWMSRKCAQAFADEAAGGPNLRERDVVQGAYERMIKRLSGYKTPPLEKMRAIGGTLERYKPPLTHIGDVTVNGLRFEAWEGRGGHVAGECVFVERAQKIAFTGDVFCNLKAYTPEQAAFNALSPRLLGSVDDDRATAAEERKAIFELLGTGSWQVFGGHGGVKLWEGNQ
ncbi:MAG: MBL fold metallo-hydrolase [Clostridia bacterium]|nr:MBL fold metallo-hydrolase [Clostridia bacterium]